VGQELKETVQLKANLTMTEARELAQKVEMLKLDLRKVGPHGVFKKPSEKKAGGEKKETADEDEDEGAPSYDTHGGSVMVDETKKLAAKAGAKASAKTAPSKASTKASKPTSKLRKAGVVPSPQPSPEPEAASADEEVAPDAPDAGADDVDRSADAGGCHSLSASLASDDWCMSNCALGNCPLTMCSTDCSSLKSGAAAAATTKELVSEGSDDDGLEPCRSIGDGPVDDGWCVSNCALGNCPEAKCGEGCLRPGKGGASKKPAQASAPAPVTPVESPVPATSGTTSGGTSGKHAETLPDEEQQTAAQEQKQGQKQEKQEHLVDVPVPVPSKPASKNVVKKSSKKASSKVEVWGADVVHPKKATVDAFLRGEDKA